MRRARPTRVRVARAVALSAALAALALALREMPPFFLALAAATVLVLATPFVEWTSVPPRLADLLPRVLVITLLTLTGVAWLSRALGALVLQATFLPLLMTPLLVPIAACFTVAPRAFPFGRTLAPTVVALLALAGLNPSPGGYGGSALPFLRAGEHNAFAEPYLVLSLVVLASLWTAAFFEGGPRWRRRDVVGLVLAGGLSMALASTSVVGLPLLQPKIEQAIAAALDQGTTGLSEESRLGEFAELAISRRRVLDLQASDAQAGPWLLRSEVFTSFDGRRWTNPTSSTATRAGSAESLRPTNPPPAIGPLLADLGAWFVPEPRPSAPETSNRHDSGSVAIRINQGDVDNWPLLLPRRAEAVTLDAPSLELDRFGLLRRPMGLAAHLYGALVAASDDRAADLSAASAAESLALPSVLDPRTRALAAELASSRNGRERLDATIAHLRQGYRYTLRPGAFHSADPLAEFLFEKKAGYCEYFASAAVILLRLEGVPARFVKGLSAGPQTDQGGGLHVVRESNAHAWVEAWLPGEGWVAADPTPPGFSAEMGARPSTWERLLEHLRAATAAAWARLLSRGPGPLLRELAAEIARVAGRVVRQPSLWLLTAMVVLGPRLVRSWRARRHRRLAAALDQKLVPVDLRALVRDIERRWSSLGRPRPLARGLIEHCRSLDADPTLGTREAAAMERAVLDAYYRARFGAEPPDAFEIARLQADAGRWCRPTRGTL